jgi:hypothetical protein
MTSLHLGTAVSNPLWRQSARRIAPAPLLYYNRCVNATSLSRPQSSRAPAPKGFFGRLWRALRQLFHETTGAIFAILALVTLGSAFRGWQNGAARWMVALPIAYAMLLIYFSVTSFRSARRVP